MFVMGELMFAFISPVCMVLFFPIKYPHATEIEKNNPYLLWIPRILMPTINSPLRCFTMLSIYIIFGIFFLLMTWFVYIGA